MRRNAEYRKNYKKFLQNFDITTGEVNPSRRKGRYNAQKRQYEWKGEAPDTIKCNLSYMMEKWGFACDPNNPIPEGSYWHDALISKVWLKARRNRPLFYHPMMDAQIHLKRLPGVYEVAKWPEMCRTEESKQKFREAFRKIRAGWKPQDDREIQEFFENTRIRWEIEDPPMLTITINLQAQPSYILYALEFLIAFCRGDLGIYDNRINEADIKRYIQAWDLKQNGLTDEQIALEIPVRKYELKNEQRGSPEMLEADQEMDEDTYYNVKRIKDYIEKAEEMIQRGSII